jgi:type IV pilus assembly protein PilM
MLADKLALRVVCFDPLRNITVLPTARIRARAVAPMLAGLVGLATSLTSGRWPGLNLLPPAAIKAQVARRRQPALLAAATVAVVAPLPVIWHYHRVVTAAGRVSAGVERRLGPFRAVAARNAGNLARLEETKQRIDALRDLVESKSNWIMFLNDLQGRLAQAEDVWLEKLQIARPATGPGDAAPAAARRFILSGRLLDRNNPVSKVSADSYGRIRSLLQLLSQSPFIATVENERFDNAQPGILRFDFTLVLDAKRAL